MDENLFFEEIMSRLQSLKDFLLEAKKELGEISDAAIKKLSGEDNLIYTSIWMLVNAYACEENKPTYFKWLENHRFSLSNVRWTETDQKRYDTVLGGSRQQQVIWLGERYRACVRLDVGVQGENVRSCPQGGGV